MSMVSNVGDYGKLEWEKIKPGGVYPWPNLPIPSSPIHIPITPDERAELEKLRKLLEEYRKLIEERIKKLEAPKS